MGVSVRASLVLLPSQQAYEASLGSVAGADFCMPCWEMLTGAGEAGACPVQRRKLWSVWIGLERIVAESPRTAEGYVTIRLQAACWQT